MPRLNDTQTLLLAHAAIRGDGSFYLLPATANGAAARATKAIAALIRLGFAEERAVSDRAVVSRRDGGTRGAFVTTAGLAAIGVADVAGEAQGASPMPVASSPPTAPARPTKSVAVVALLQRADGATLPELVSATGWLRHTTRAALTGLRKKGHAIDRFERDNATCYRIGAAA